MDAVTAGDVSATQSNSSTVSVMASNSSSGTTSQNATVSLATSQNATVSLATSQEATVNQIVETLRLPGSLSTRVVVEVLSQQRVSD